MGICSTFFGPSSPHSDDERLKPSRTLHYVAAAVALTVILACLMMFFLYPRSFTISQKIGKDYCGPKLYPYNLTINTAGKTFACPRHSLT